MKKLILFGLILISSNTTFAKNVKLTIQTHWKKGEISKSNETTVIAKLGQEWTVPFTDKDSFKMKMKVSESGPNSDVLMEGRVFIMEQGIEKVIANPKIISRYNTEAILTTEDENGEFFEIKITPIENL